MPIAIAEEEEAITMVSKNCYPSKCSKEENLTTKRWLRLVSEATQFTTEVIWCCKLVATEEEEEELEWVAMILGFECQTK